MNDEAIIGKELTTVQYSLVVGISEDLTKISHEGKTAKELEIEIITALLDATMLSKMHPSFTKKLEIIQNLVRTGRWSTPRSMQKSGRDAYSNKPTNHNKESQNEQMRLRVGELFRNQTELRYQLMIAKNELEQILPPPIYKKDETEEEKKEKEAKRRAIVATPEYKAAISKYNEINLKHMDANQLFVEASCTWDQFRAVNNFPFQSYK